MCIRDRPVRYIKVLFKRFCKTYAGIEDDLIVRYARLLGYTDGYAEISDHVVQEVVIAGVGAVMHKAYRGVVFLCRLGAATVVPEAPYVVQQIGARVQCGARDRAFICVYRNGNVKP